MIISVDISQKTLSKQGKTFKWSKPSGCPKCNHSLWGHGYVLFNGLFLKRYRCNGCSTIITLKPAGFWKKYQSNIEKIYIALRYRFTGFRRVNDVSRQRQNQWLKKYIHFIKMHILCEQHYREMHPVDLLDYLYLKNIPFLS